jgi:hypothetical protein
MTARIYKPARNAMQSGKANTKAWILEFEPEARRTADPLMGWTSSGDMKQQLRLSFDTQQQAVEYALRNGIAYELVPEAPARPVRKAYADNFKWGRKDNWTH